MKLTDFRVISNGQLYVVWPKTDEAAQWLERNIIDELPRWGNALVIDQRYIHEVVSMIQSYCRAAA